METVVVVALYLPSGPITSSMSEIHSEKGSGD